MPTLRQMSLASLAATVTHRREIHLPEKSNLTPTPPFTRLE